MYSIYDFIVQSKEATFLEMFYSYIELDFRLQQKLKDLLKNTKYRNENFKKPSFSAVNQAYIFSNTNLKISKEQMINPIFLSYVIQKRADDELLVKSCNKIIKELTNTVPQEPYV